VRLAFAAALEAPAFVAARVCLHVAHADPRADAVALGAHAGNSNGEALDAARAACVWSSALARHGSRSPMRSR
jgi:hypothetical protein